MRKGNGGYLREIRERSDWEGNQECLVWMTERFVREGN